MKLDVYRDCSRREKRDVLESFWRAKGPSTSRITTATLQYGPAAIACLVVIAIELAIIIAAAVGRSHLVALIACALEVLNVLALGWSVVRFRSLRSKTAH